MANAQKNSVLIMRPLRSQQYCVPLQTHHKLLCNRRQWGVPGLLLSGISAATIIFHVKEVKLTRSKNLKYNAMFPVKIHRFSKGSSKAFPKHEYEKIKMIAKQPKPTKSSDHIMWVKRNEAYSHNGKFQPFRQNLFLSVWSSSVLSNHSPQECLQIFLFQTNSTLVRKKLLAI